MIAPKTYFIKRSYLCALHPLLAKEKGSLTLKYSTHPTAKISTPKGKVFLNS